MTYKQEEQHPTKAVEEEEEGITPRASPKLQPSRSRRSSRYHRSPSLEDGSPDLFPALSRVSTHDGPGISDQRPGYEPGDEIYHKFSHLRKVTIVTVLSFCSFLAPISSTSILAASPEVVKTFHTTGAIFGISNALYMVFMGLSALVYGPLGSTYGRKWPMTVAAITFTAFSIGTALAPNLASFFGKSRYWSRHDERRNTNPPKVFRLLTAFQGTCFLIVGGTVIGDIYRPIERGTAYGWFLSGTLIGPALGPFIGGIIVTYASWRDIFWLQTVLAGISTLGVIFLVPETIHRKRSDELSGLPRKQKVKKLWSWINPWRVIKLFRYPNVLVVGIAASSLVWNMYVFPAILFAFPNGSSIFDSLPGPTCLR